MSGFHRWCRGYCTEQQCKFPYLAENMDSSSTTTRGSTNTTRAGPRAAGWNENRPGYQLCRAAAGYPAPILTRLHQAPLRLYCCWTVLASRLHPLTKTTFHLVIRTHCEEATLRFKWGGGCLFVSERSPEGTPMKSQEDRLMFRFKRLQSIFSALTLWSLL